MRQRKPGTACAGVGNGGTRRARFAPGAAAIGRVMSGLLAGKEFFKQYCTDVKDIPSLARIVQEQFRSLGIGIVRFEVADAQSMTFQLTVDEDLDCSGLPDSEDHICIYDEGFIKGILDSFTGKNFSVREIDCWCSGARTCRFRASLAE